MSETLTASIPTPLERRVTAVLTTLCDREMTIATAESCTGGLLASVLTDVDGLGHAFERGHITYTDASKTDELGVPHRLIETHSAVSAPVARAMAEGALRRSSASVAVSVTGYAGPGDEAAEEGLVYVALAADDDEAVVAQHRFGPLGRGPIRIKALEAVIGLLEDHLS